MKIRACYPAVGNIQTLLGQEHGIWYTWTRFKGRDLKKHSHFNNDEAFECYDSNVELFKGLDQNASSVEAALEAKRQKLLEERI